MSALEAVALAYAILATCLFTFGLLYCAVVGFNVVKARWNAGLKEESFEPLDKLMERWSRQ